jgi:hypothetical protein
MITTESSSGVKEGGGNANSLGRHLIRCSGFLGVEAVSKPLGPRLGASIPLAVREQREQSMTRVAGVFDHF